MSEDTFSKLQKNSMYRWILVPGTAKGEGSGHLVRAMELARFLPDAEMLLDTDRRAELEQKYPELSSIPLLPSLDGLPENGGNAGKHPVFVVDKRRLSSGEMRELGSRGTVVAIDAVGKEAAMAAFVVDLLPRAADGAVSGFGAPSNLTNYNFNPMPTRTRDTKPGWQNILISFGGEDPKNLRETLIRSGVIQRFLPNSHVDLQNGPLSAELRISLPENWTAQAPRTPLRNFLAGYDLVITSFGLTAFEARAAGCRVFLLNPSGYHQKLGRKAGFFSIGIKKPSAETFLRGIETNEGLAPAAVAQMSGVANQTANPAPAASPQARISAADSQIPTANGSQGLAECLLSLERLESTGCPACKNTANTVVARFADRSFYDCGLCGIRYMQLFGVQHIAYNEAYFFDEYKKQYGKTYLDDFEHIKSMGNSRLERIDTVRTSAKTRGNLLDIGCAYGPFLSAAFEKGYSVYGCDISPEAVRYVSGTLGFPAISEDIRKLDQKSFGVHFDVVTMWYVVEHFPDLYNVIPALNKLLKKGGILALSTPSGQGISSKARPTRFLDQSPRDHYSIWMPTRVARLLRMYGFRLKRIQSTGHHPERFPGFLGQTGFRSLSATLSRLFRLGDTFELYAEKVRETA